jgi:coproporphyrinogen III oxidase
MPDLPAVQKYLESLQDTICDVLEVEDGEASFDRREIEREGGGLSRPRVLEGGPVIEKAAVNYSRRVGKRLPRPSAAPS